jgi:hypothetical protein
MRYQPLFWPVIGIFFGALPLFSQELVNPYWEMQTPWASFSPASNFTVSALSPGNNYGNTVFLNELSPSSGYTGASGSWNASLAARVGPLQKEPSGSVYLEFSITPALGYRFIVKAISFGIRSTQTGPRQWSLYQHEDQYAQSLAQGPVVNNSTWSLVEVNGINFSAAKAVHFRIYGFDGEGIPAINVANWRLDDLRLQLQVVPDNLPVKWLYQRVQTATGQVRIQWATQEEVQVKSFIIQRSTDAIHFENIAELPAQSGNSVMLTTFYYTFLDTTPLPGRSFYRIVQKDISGAREEGTILLVQRSVDEQLFLKGQIVYSSSSRMLKLPFEYNGPVDLQLFSLNGQMIGNYRLWATGGVVKFIPPQWVRGYHVLLLTTSMGINGKRSFCTTAYVN